MKRLWFFEVRTFNSIKVQLRPQREQKTNVRTCRFQFHKGTIKAQLLSYLHDSPCDFQFHKGTIKASCQDNKET